MEKKNYYNGDHSIFDDDEETIKVDVVKQVHSRRMEDDGMSNGGRRASRMSDTDHHSRRMREDRLRDSREPRQRKRKSNW